MTIKQLCCVVTSNLEPLGANLNPHAYLRYTHYDLTIVAYCFSNAAQIPGKHFIASADGKQPIAALVVLDVSYRGSSVVRVPETILPGQLRFWYRATLPTP